METNNIAFDKFTEEYLTFRNYRNNGLNGIAMYPAMMIDEMQKNIIEAVMQLHGGSNLTLLDPFHGAGTSLLIAKELGMNQIGFDINPLANLITKVKLHAYDETIFIDKTKLFNIIDNTDEITDYTFHKIEKWFRDDITSSLSKIRSAIMQLENEYNRFFFWTVFSNIVRRYSNSRSSTFKLHIKEQEKMDEMIDNSIEDFKKEVNQSIKKLSFEEVNENTSQLICGDSLELINNLDNESIDIICTSPPYGDNQTTVTYGQFSSLALRWINHEDLDEQVEVVDYNFSSLDNLSLGGRRRQLTTNVACLEEYLGRIKENKRQKVINFVSDYVNIFSGLVEKLRPNGYIVLTVGNRKVDNQLFPFVQVNDELAVLYNLEKVTEKKRDILNKRIAKKISRVDEQSVESMSEEYILIYKKGDNENE